MKEKELRALQKLKEVYFKGLDKALPENGTLRDKLKKSFNATIAAAGRKASKNRDYPMPPSLPLWWTQAHTSAWKQWIDGRAAKKKPLPASHVPGRWTDLEKAIVKEVKAYPDRSEGQIALEIIRRAADNLWLTFYDRTQPHTYANREDLHKQRQANFRSAVSEADRLGRLD